MTISVHFNADADLYELWCSDRRMSPAPAGPRLFRGGPHPQIAFTHETREAAARDAATLSTYLASVAPKQPTKKELRQFAA